MTVMTVIGSLVIVNSSAITAYAAGRSGPQDGNDVSYPQCGQVLLSHQAFGIVGVNDGRANTTNPCLAGEIRWARKSSGGTRQERLSFYVNTGNPAHLKVADWPKNNDDHMTRVEVRDPYGRCAGRDDRACSWQYGWNMAELDVRTHHISKPGRYRWWLDVETATSWDRSTWNNRADLEGMVAYFHRAGVVVGIYSTAFQWYKIVEIVPPVSSLYRLADWVPGARTLPQAKANCRLAPLTGRGVISVTQWTASETDHDLSCAR
ncbi:MAG: hypothetical protein ABSA53_17295 [Streptosporangiaceae bacterium]